LYRCLQTVGCAFGFFMAAGMQSPEEWDDCYGEGGCDLVEASRTHTSVLYDQMHEEICKTCGWDPAAAGGLGGPLAIVWGNMTMADELWANSFSMAVRTEKGQPGLEGFQMWVSLHSMISPMFHTGRSATCAKYLRETEWTWSGAWGKMMSIEGVMGGWCKEIAHEGVKLDALHIASTHAWFFKMAHALVDESRLSAADLKTIPSPTELRKMAQDQVEPEVQDHEFFFTVIDAVGALLLEKYGEFDRALEFAEFARERGTHQQIESNVVGDMCQGRIMAIHKQQPQEAIKLFEAAIELAEAKGFRCAHLTNHTICLLAVWLAHFLSRCLRCSMYALLALRDMQVIHAKLLPLLGQTPVHSSTCIHMYGECTEESRSCRSTCTIGRAAVTRPMRGWGPCSLAWNPTTTPSTKFWGKDLVRHSLDGGLRSVSICVGGLTSARSMGADTAALRRLR
jgi:hypothetical protein